MTTWVADIENKSDSLEDIRLKVIHASLEEVVLEPMVEVEGGPLCTTCAIPILAKVCARWHTRSGGHLSNSNLSAIFYHRTKKRLAWSLLAFHHCVLHPYSSRISFYSLV